MVRIWEAYLKEHPQADALPVILPVVLMHNAQTWKIKTRLSALLDLPPGAAESLRPFIPDFGFHALQLAEMSYGGMLGTPSGILILRVMKAERLNQLLDDAVWDEALLMAVPRRVFDLVLRYILGADIDKEAFETKIHTISHPKTRRIAMTLAERYHNDGRQEGRVEGRQEKVIEALEIRFDVVPVGLREAIQEVRDEAHLRRLHRAAIQCASLEAFSKAL